MCIRDSNIPYFFISHYVAYQVELSQYLENTEYMTRRFQEEYMKWYVNSNWNESKYIVTDANNQDLVMDNYNLQRMLIVYIPDYTA